MSGVSTQSTVISASEQDVELAKEALSVIAKSFSNELTASQKVLRGRVLLFGRMLDGGEFNFSFQRDKDSFVNGVRHLAQFAKELGLTVN